MKELSFREFAWVTQAVFGAGSDTTAATLNTFILGITCFPETLVAAQEELDRVIGTERLPTFEDEEKLPYIRAMVKETLRWRPVAVLGGTVIITLWGSF
jgi:cytochrome P450